MRTEYEFILPRGYLDENGTVHRRGTMRLATARDELEPLRDPTINSADDPRLTIVVLARVVQTLGSLTLVTAHEIESLMEAQQELLKPAAPRNPPPPPPTAVAGSAEVVNGPTDGGGAERPLGRRGAIEEVPASGR
jgi:hypothetical protein